MSDEGLDKKARRAREAREREEARRAPALNPKFPYRTIEFDPQFFGVADEPEQAPESV